MHCKSYRVALAAAALVLAGFGTIAHADPLGLEAGSVTPTSFDGTTVNITGGDTFNTTTSDSYPYDFDLKLTLLPGADYTVVDIDGDEDVTGTFAGTYSFYIGSTIVSAGTLTADGEFYLSGGIFPIGPSLTNGIATQTSGAGFDIYPGVTQFSFVGNNDTDGPYFNGALSPAVSAVPLPASATMGAGLLAILAPIAVRRRRMASAAFAISR